MHKILMGIVFGIVFVKVNVFGAASILSSLRGGDEIIFNSNVQKVRVFINGSPIGIIHSTLKYRLERDGAPKRVDFKKDGYKTETVFITTKLSPSIWGNAIFAYYGSFSSSTDSWSTRNSRQYTPNQFYIEMEKI